MAVSFDAMGTEVTLTLPDASPDDEEAFGVRVATLFELAEQRFSRFREDSELSRLHRAVGPTAVSRALFTALVRCQSHARATGGLFDPGVGAALIAMGYDRSFAPAALDRPAAEGAAPVGCGSVLDVVLDDARCTAELPPGLRLDLGGFVKGATVDEAMALLPARAALNAGGDAALRGAGPDGGGWLVEVEDPRAPTAVLARFRATDVCVATSGIARRHWRVGAETRHHLIDPRTGRSARSGLAQVTVLAGTTADAEVLAKAAFVLGAEAGAEFLTTRGCVGALLVGVDGRVLCVGALTSQCLSQPPR